LDRSILNRNDFKVFKVLSGSSRESEPSLCISRNRNSFSSGLSFDLSKKFLFSAEFIQLLSVMFCSSRFSSEWLLVNGVLRCFLNEDILVTILPRRE